MALLADYFITPVLLNWVQPFGREASPETVDIIEAFRERSDKAGYGYQTMINEALREYLMRAGKPLDETVIRQVIREELERVVHH